MGLQESVIIELSDKGARNFMEYQRHKEFFDRLIEHDVHKMSHGNAILSFKLEGQVAAIKFEQFVFKL